MYSATTILKPFINNNDWGIFNERDKQTNETFHNVMVSKFLLSDPLREGLRYFKDVAALLRLVRFPWQKRLEFTHICWSKKELQNQLSRNLWKSSLGRKLYVVKNLGAISAFADTFNYPYQLLMVDVVWLD